MAVVLYSLVLNATCRLRATRTNDRFSSTSYPPHTTTNDAISTWMISNFFIKELRRPVHPGQGTDQVTEDSAKDRWSGVTDSKKGTCSTE